MKLVIRMFVLTTFAVVLGAASVVSAQNMSGTVSTKEIKFAKGKSEATMWGSARYARSYVYTLGAKAGQTMEISVSAKNQDLRFSVIGPDEETLEDAFGVTEWLGKLPLGGKYQVVIVMNDENAGSVPFSLKAKIK